MSIVTQRSVRFLYKILGGGCLAGGSSLGVQGSNGNTVSCGRSHHRWPEPGRDRRVDRRRGCRKTSSQWQCLSGALCLCLGDGLHSNYCAHTKHSSSKTLISLRLPQLLTARQSDTGTLAGRAGGMCSRQRMTCNFHSWTRVTLHLGFMEPCVHCRIAVPTQVKLLPG
jgi:hypothetical protein